MNRSDQLCDEIQAGRIPRLSDIRPDKVLECRRKIASDAMLVPGREDVAIVRAVEDAEGARMEGDRFE